MEWHKFRDWIIKYLFLYHQYYTFIYSFYQCPGVIFWKTLFPHTPHNIFPRHISNILCIKNTQEAPCAAFAFRGDLVIKNINLSSSSHSFSSVLLSLTAHTSDICIYIFSSLSQKETDEERKNAQKRDARNYVRGKFTNIYINKHPVHQCVMPLRVLMLFAGRRRKCAACNLRPASNALVCASSRLSAADLYMNSHSMLLYRAPAIRRKTRRDCVEIKDFSCPFFKPPPHPFPHRRDPPVAHRPSDAILKKKTYLEKGKTREG